LRQAPLVEDAEGRIDDRFAIVTYMPFGPHATHYTERRSPERCSPRHGDTMTDAPRRPQTRRFETRDIARIAVFAAIIAALGLVGPVPVPGLVPITAQTLGVILAGMVLGAWRGAAAVLVFELLVLIGLPLLSGGHGGPASFVGPASGYLIGWIPGAFVTGLIAHSGRGGLSWWRVGLGGVVGGVLVVYALGIPVQAAITVLPLGAAALTSIVFL